MSICRECKHSRPTEHYDTWMCVSNKDVNHVISPGTPSCSSFQPMSSAKPKIKTHKPRKPMQIVEVNSCAVALCDDGTMWRDEQRWNAALNGWEKVGWQQMDPIPQDEVSDL